MAHVSCLSRTRYADKDRGQSSDALDDFTVIRRNIDNSSDRHVLQTMSIEDIYVYDGELVVNSISMDLEQSSYQ